MDAGERLDGGGCSKVEVAGLPTAAAKIGRCTRFGLGAMNRANSRPWRVSASTFERFFRRSPRASGGMLQGDRESRESDGEFSSRWGPDLMGIIPYPSPMNESSFQDFRDLPDCIIDPRFQCV